MKERDPNPLSTGPTKWRAEHCVTHHHACDCREWEHACEVERLQAEIDSLRAMINAAPIGEIVGGRANSFGGYHVEVKADHTWFRGQHVRLLVEIE